MMPKPVIILFLLISLFFSNASVSFASDSGAVVGTAKTVVSFVSDDLSANDWAFRDVFISRGLAYTIPTVVANIGTQISLARLKSLQNDFGYEIGSHGVDHVKMTEQTPEQLTYQLLGSKTQLRNLGFKCNNFFVPFGSYNQTVLNEAIKYYRAVRTSDKGFNSAPFNLQNIKGYWLDNTSLLATEKARVDSAVENNSWLVLSFHTNGVNRKFMDEVMALLLDYIKSKDIQILTFDKALDYYGVTKLDDYVPPSPDTVKPVFSGIADININLNDSFNPLLGITATDNIDGDITSRISVSGSVNTGLAGSYTLTYTVSDLAGNTAKVLRTVTVIGLPESELQPLYKLPNGKKDEMTETQIIRRVGKIILNGTEDWQRYAVDGFADESVLRGFKLLFNTAHVTNDDSISFLVGDKHKVFLIMGWGQILFRE